ncbi:ABC transporter ATP-binding protein [Enterococcus caccae]|uniref:ABC transporter ATP-binding protein n=1 Tax=Enterococcus caccae ATCC BAA-1240 TaxID=1158612 RepID=R3WI28_9ENTE|nr:ABC transporter ATP-binding protein [Enterococcus caccae]EOL47092.1 ABC transporter ATP-binding protein [Enterococcus caccae ATCC BAA-1240]EOT65734.1 ABC transporter ATP-binding protein [Enterococcus caccae ATCC BAA-1240]OJG24588.1 ABC transporter ATP-binding protein [Enterococcus caccae]
MKKPLITFKDFTFQYHSQAEPTLHNIDLTIYEGEKVLIVGPSGSGKSTFAQCVNGLIPYSYEGKITGEVNIGDKKLTETSLVDLSFEVGTVLQDTDGQFIGLTVGEDVAFALENDEVSQTKMKEEVDHWTKIVGLNEFLHHRPQDLSGGQKQRVSMAGVLIDEAPILLFDEPLANLDPKAGKETIALIEEIHQKTETTILIIEHRLEDVLYRSVDRIIVFNEGRVVADLPADELLKTNILTNQGIREPLYITAMKYAGIDLETVLYLSNIEKVQAPNLKEQMENWMKNQVQISEKPVLPPLLTLENVTYQYNRNDRYVLNDVSVVFNRGEMLSIVGKNGAGKSTLSKAICGFVTPQSGKMSWLGEDLTQFSIKERADKIGFVMQNPNQMISKKMIFEEVALGLTLKGIPTEEIKERVEKVLKICGLYSFRHWPISALSFGQKKRVTIAAILVLEPEMIVLDEPTAGQDFKHYTEMMTFLEALNKLGVTIAMITHDMHLMLEYTDRALVLYNGEIIADTTPVNLLTDTGLVEQASLKETSLFTFAQHLGLEDPFLFTENFMTYDQEVRLK